MSTVSVIEQRLAAVEQAVVELQDRLAGGSHAANWVERFRGAFKDEPAFDQVIEYGRALRTAHHPGEESGP